MVLSSAYDSLIERYIYVRYPAIMVPALLERIAYGPENGLSHESVAAM